jgi:hypothetical protein
MASITIAQICDAIETTLSSATGLNRSETYSELSDGITEEAWLQVYPETLETDVATGTDRTTFRGGVRQTEFTFHADLYARQRSHIGDDMRLLVQLIDAIVVKLEQQATKPYFGLEGIKAFRWRGERVTFIYGDRQLPYVGMRFTITVRVF